jgi:hypothetical protein
MARQTSQEAASQRDALQQSVDSQQMRDAARAKRNHSAEATIRKALSRAMRSIDQPMMIGDGFEQKAAAVDHLLNALINCDKVQW